MNRKNQPARFAICIDTGDYRASLELRKIYRILPDPTAAVRGYVRVVDESGEDYLYPKGYFLPIALPKAVKRALLLAS